MKKFDPVYLTFLILSLCGVLFAGYLSLTKFFTGSCALGETCPYLFRLPVCVYGLVLYLGLFAISAMLFLKRGNEKQLLRYFFGIAVFGILFSGYYSIQEIFFPKCVQAPCTYALILPTCVYGLIMYCILFVLAVFASRRGR